MAWWRWVDSGFFIVGVAGGLVLSTYGLVAGRRAVADAWSYFAISLFGFSSLCWGALGLTSLCLGPSARDVGYLNQLRASVGGIGIFVTLYVAGQMKITRSSKRSQS